MIFATLIVGLSILSVSAAAQHRVLGKLEIPFNFTANDQVFASGNYDLVQIGGQTIRLEERKTGKGITLLSPQNISETPVNTLLFHRYGTRYVLAKIVAPTYEMPLFKSNTERELASGMKFEAVTLRAGK
jgi:hypothetical protein